MIKNKLWFINIILAVILLAGLCFLFQNKNYLKLNPWGTYEYGYEATRINYGYDGKFYARLSSAQELLKVNLNNEVEKFITFEKIPLNAEVEQYAIDIEGNIFTVEIDPGNHQERKTIYSLKKYDNNGKLINVITDFESKKHDINSLIVSPITCFQTQGKALFFMEMTDKELNVKKYDSEGLHKILIFDKKIQYINDVEDYDFLTETNTLVIAFKNGKIVIREADGKEKTANSGWTGEVTWNISNDNRGGFYYADLNSSRIYNVNPLYAERRIMIDLNEQQEIIDANYSDEILRNFSVNDAGYICVNGRKNILLISPEGVVTAYPSAGKFASDFKYYLCTIWIVFVLCLLIVLYFGIKLMHYVVKYPTELATVMFYLFLIAAAGMMAAKLAHGNVLRDYEKTLMKDNQQRAVIAARIFDAKAIQAIGGKNDYDKSEFRTLQDEADAVFRPAGEKDIGADRLFVLYKLHGDTMRLLLTNGWNSLWQPLPRNETTEEFYELLEKKSFDNSIDYFGEKTYLTSYVPVFDDNDATVGMVEVSYDLSNIHNDLRVQFWRDMIGIIFLLITFHLIIVELNQLIGAWKKSRAAGLSLRENTSVIRLVSFLTYMTVSMSLLYCAARIVQFDQSAITIPKELVMALPFAVEMISVITLNLFLASYMDGWGWKPRMLLGVFLMIIGCIMTWWAESLSVFLLGRVLNGAAFAIQGNALKAFIVCENDLEQRKIGQAERTTGRFTGELCGITIGTLIATYSSLQTTFLCSAVVALVLFFVVWLLTKNRHMEIIADDKISTLQAFWVMLKEPRMLFFLLLVFFPFYFLEGFNSYLVPVVVKNMQLDKDYIGYASFIVYLCCAYFSKPLALNLSKKMSLYLCILCGLALYLAATLVLQIMEGLAGILLASIIFGIGISINGGLITEMFLRSYIAKKIGINNMNNICGILFAVKSGLGPVLLGVFWKFAGGNGILLYCGISVLLALMYFFFYRKDITQ